MSYFAESKRINRRCRACPHWEINPRAAAQRQRDRIADPVRSTLPQAVVRGIEEQLSGARTTGIAAFDEFAAFLTDPALLRDYHMIIFDTAPIGHTIGRSHSPQTDPALHSW